MGLINDYFEKIKFRKELKTLEIDDLNKMQLEEVMNGLRSGLAVSQIKLYAHDVLNHYQMSEIRAGMDNGLSKLQVALYANKPQLTYAQMQEVRIALEGNLSNSQVDTFAKPNLQPDQMVEIRKGYENGFSSKQVEFIIKQTYLAAKQMEQVRLALENELPMTTINEIIKDDTGKVRGTKEMESIRTVYEEHQEEVAKKNVKNLRIKLSRVEEQAIEKPKSESAVGKNTKASMSVQEDNIRAYEEYQNEMDQSFTVPDMESFIPDEGEEMEV